MLGKIWDLFLLQGWKFAFQLSLVILKNVTKKIEAMRHDELVAYLRSALGKSVELKVIC